MLGEEDFKRIAHEVLDEVNAEQREGKSGLAAMILRVKRHYGEGMRDGLKRAGYPRALRSDDDVG